MRELIKAEERLMFARHNPPRAVRKEAGTPTRSSEPDPSPARPRILLGRKELY